MEFFVELWAYMRHRKKFWLMPVLVVLVTLGGLLVVTKGSAVSTFVYTLF